MKPSPKQQKPLESSETSISFDDNYNEEDCLHQNNQIQKLSIMDDFNQLCLKLNHPLEQQKTQTTTAENTLAAYYARLRQKNQQQDQKKDTTTLVPQNNFEKNISNHIFDEKTIKTTTSQTQSQNIRSPSNIPQNPQQTIPLQIQKPQRNPSQGEAFKKKIVQQMEMNDTKRNYSSVEDKKKILQPSKNPTNTQQNLSMKDYFGDQKNIILKRQTIKTILQKQPRQSKENILTYINQPKESHPQKNNKENIPKESNMLNQPKKSEHVETQKNSKVTTEKDIEKHQKPKIVLFSRKINLNQETQKLKAMLREEQMRSDYDMSNVSISSIEEGLFKNAIEKQRNSKNAQNVLSPQVHVNLLPPNRKEQISNGQKQFMSSPINISHSPNPTNAPKSIFQKREGYRC